MSTTRRIAVLVLLLTACAAGHPYNGPKEFDGKQAMAYVVTQVGFGPRVPGTPGHARAAAWIDSMARAGADSVVLQRWWHHAASGDSVEMINILAQLNPAATERVLYVAHWDTKPHASNDAKDTLGVMPGANDGGSGVAILLGVMDAMRKSKPTIGVDLLFVDGEDYGSFGPPRRVDVLVGAEYYAKHQLAAKPLFAVLYDMVGGKDLVIPKETNSVIAAEDVVEKMWGIAEGMGYGHIFTRQQQFVTDDHIPLIEGGIRIIDVITDLNRYPAWHTTGDTPDKLSVQSLEAVGNVAVAMIRAAKE
jgi:hypothetical protein